MAETKPGEWFCVVAAREHDYNFREATKYGPCGTHREAVAAMSDVESNPGGYNVVKYNHMTDLVLSLVHRARAFKQLRSY